jgi:hypothetical protein
MAFVEGIKIDLGNIWEGVGKLASSIREAITGTPSPEKQAAAAAALMQIEFMLTQGQLKINEIEASHQSTFVAGWRPAVGWVCVFGFAWYYVLAPFTSYAIQIAGYVAPPLPVLDMGELMTLLFGILGLGTLRSYDKSKGTSGTMK